MFRVPSGRACDSYRRWREDVDLVAGLGLDAYRFSVEWARVEPAEGEFSAEALAHYRAIVDRCLVAGITPVVTYNHFTSPHWFARRGGWLDPRAPAVFARYCGRVTEHLGDGIGWAVTLNEPNLPRLLRWLDIPEAVRGLERATLVAAGEQAGVPAYRVANIVLTEEMDAMADGMTAGHQAAKEAIKARRPDLPVGLSLAIVDDQVVGDDASVRDRKRAEVYGRWLALARDGRLRGRAELRAHPVRRRRTRTSAAGRHAEPDGLGGPPAVAGGSGPLRARGDRRARAGDRARAGA